MSLILRVTPLGRSSVMGSFQPKLELTLRNIFRHQSNSAVARRTQIYPRLFGTSLRILGNERHGPSTSDSTKPVIRENIYTLPNLLTASRILACPVLGWSILEGDFVLATSLLAYAGISDWVDGFIARKYQMRTVLGTILDPAADKALMTTLTITLTMQSMIPIPLAVIILGRDVLLSLSAFYIRYKSLPPPKTFSRYWDFGIPSAEVRPTTISKVNTALQLLLMASTTVSPLLAIDTALPMQLFQWIVGGTTIWSGLGYIFSRDAVRYVSSPKKSP